jgi:pyridoxal phosphate enzyme (YggS family)
MVGHLQRNKVKTALSLFSMIHSLDSLKLAAEISKRAVAAEQTVDLLVQVNTTGEGSKFGISPGDLDRFLEQASELPSIRIKGLMTIGPFTDDEKAIRRSFKALRHLFEEVRGIWAYTKNMRYLSMGMTDDFEIAIEEGSNMIRIGTALFGPREQGGGQIENYTT